MAKVATKTVVKAKPVLKTRTKEAPVDDRKEAKRLIEVIQESWFDFSQVVARVYHENKWQEWGYKDFEACCKGEWNREYRDMMNRVKAGDAIQKFGITKVQAKQCGWTNFMEMASVFDPEMKASEIDRLIKKAGKMTHDEIQRFKKELRTGKSGGEETTRVTMIFRFLDEQAKLVETVLETGKEVYDTPNADTALENILVDWMASHTEDDKAVAKLKKEVAKRLAAEQKETAAAAEAEEEEDEEEEKPKRKQRADAGKARTKKKAAEEEEEDEDEDEEADDDEEVEDEDEDEEDEDDEDDVDLD